MTNRIFSTTSVFIKTLTGNKANFYELSIFVLAIEFLSNAAKTLATCRLYQKLPSRSFQFIIPLGKEIFG